MQDYAYDRLLAHSLSSNSTIPNMHSTKLRVLYYAFAWLNAFAGPTLCVVAVYVGFIADDLGLAISWNVPVILVGGAMTASSILFFRAPVSVKNIESDAVGLLRLALIAAFIYVVCSLIGDLGAERNDPVTLYASALVVSDAIACSLLLFFMSMARRKPLICSEHA